MSGTIYDWYKIFNLTDFEALGLVSRTYEFFLENVGQKTVLVTKGNLVSMTYGGVMLPVQFDDKNPFEFEHRAVYIDDSNDVYLGIEVVE